MGILQVRIPNPERWGGWVVAWYCVSAVHASESRARAATQDVANHAQGGVGAQAGQMGE